MSAIQMLEKDFFSKRASLDIIMVRHADRIRGFVGKAVPSKPVWPADLHQNQFNATSGISRTEMVL